MKHIDFGKDLRSLYTAKKKIEEVEADRGVYLVVADQGEPGGEQFTAAIEALYSVGYTLKFELKKEGVIDFKIPKLECSWDVDDPAQTPPREWRWRLMLRVPEEVSGTHVRQAKKKIATKKGIDTSKLSRRSMKEGKALQVLHVGPYEELHRSYQALTAEAGRLGYRVRGPGHEVYLSDPRRVEPARLKTIVRMPISHPRPAHSRRAASRGASAPA